MESDKKALILNAAKEGNMFVVEYLSNEHFDLANCMDEKTGESPILLAARHGYLEMVKFLLKKQVYVNRPNLQDEYPIFEALKNQHEEIAILLIQYGVNFLIRDRKGYTILMLAVQSNMKKAVELIIKEYPFNLHATCKKGQNALMIAYMKGHTDMMWMLKKRGIKMDFVSNHDVLLFLNQLLNQSEMEKQKRLDLALRFAVENNMASVIKNLIDLGANPNCYYNDNVRLLFLCAYHENLKCFEILYSFGACIDVKNDNGVTIWHAVICAENLPMFKRLIELSPDKVNLWDAQQKLPKLTSNLLYIAIVYEATEVLNYIFTQMPRDVVKKMIRECTPLYYAIFYGRYESVNTLLNFIDVNKKSKNGETPLTFLARRKVDKNCSEGFEAKLSQIAQLLIRRGADIYAVSAKGENALKIARDAKKNTLAEMLTEKISPSVTRGYNVGFNISPKQISEHKIKDENLALRKKKVQVF